MEESKRGDDAMQAMELDADELEAVGILANMSNPLHQVVDVFINQVEQHSWSLQAILETNKRLLKASTENAVRFDASFNNVYASLVKQGQYNRADTLFEEAYSNALEQLVRTSPAGLYQHRDEADEALVARLTQMTISEAINLKAAHVYDEQADDDGSLSFRPGYGHDVAAIPSYQDPDENGNNPFTL